MDHVPYIVNWVCIAYRLHFWTYYFVSHNLLDLLPFLPRKTIMVFTFSFFSYNLLDIVLCFSEIHKSAQTFVYYICVGAKRKTLKNRFNFWYRIETFKRSRIIFLQILCVLSPWENLEISKVSLHCYLSSLSTWQVFACEQYKVDIIQQNDC